MHFASVVRYHFDNVNKDLCITFTISGAPYFAEPVKFHFERASEEAFQKKLEGKQADQHNQLLKKIGFRLFWKEIIASKKPIVGHNFFQDLMFMLNMHESDLPEDYATFKRYTCALFPSIYDTKSIASQLVCKFPVTHLGVLYNQCRSLFGMSASQFSRYFYLPPGFYEYDDEYIKVSAKAHEGAYDAYMTGVVFIYLSTVQGNSRQS
ncbi:hypothetical protein STCU_00561 [Strigomonas culicis]|uniref:Uncharacterized protein n=1 Tax=Strigomonas culicis TaxID=28005 RepID=S9V6L1_9TRYP|nr:hypothetical protein STCU_00561 [Strigomonas culicis]|eukprot:EPY36478.1 hypothetical protein STCU_00561 [Strigomonas culicis]